MTRDEQIQQKVTDLWINGADLSYAKAFKEGAQWADENPHWHKFPDEKPTEGKWYFIYEIDEDINLDFWERDYEIWSNSYDDRVVAWMELPQPPKFG